MFRKLAIAAVVVLLLIAGGLYYFLSSLNELVASAIESSGSEVTGTRVSVSGVDISLREGRGSIRGLRIANPAGFSGDAVSFSDITIVIDTSSLTSGSPIVLSRVEVQKPVVNLVLAADGSTNLQTLQKNIESHTSSDKPPATSENKSSGGAPTLLRIDKLEIDSAHLLADVSAVGGKNYEANLPALRRSNLGGARGATPGVIGQTVLREFVTEVAESIARSEAKHQINKLIDDKVGGEVGEAAKGLVGELFGR